MSGSTWLAESARPLQESYDCALLDLDGVVYRGEAAVEHAAVAISAARAAGMRSMFVTNNASRTARAVADHLTDIGVPTGAEEVTTAAMAAASLIANEADPSTRVLVIGGAGLRDAIADEGLTTVSSADEAPTVVVQGYSPDLTWHDLAEAAYAIGAGAVHIASNLDASLPTARGFAPGNGALVGAVVAATRVQPRSTGKPQPEIFQQAARRADGTRPLVIGDRLDTDLAGARNAAMPGLHVSTGVDGPREVLRAAPGQRPSYLGVDLRALAQPHPAPQRAGEWWVCRDAAARINGQEVVLRRDGAQVVISADSRHLDLDEYRAAAAAAWANADDAGQDTVLGEEFPDLYLSGPAGAESAG